MDWSRVYFSISNSECGSEDLWWMSFIVTIIVAIIVVNITAIIIVGAGRECVEAAIYTCQVITIGLFPLSCPPVQCAVVCLAPLCSGRTLEVWALSEQWPILLVCSACSVVWSVKRHALYSTVVVLFKVNNSVFLCCTLHLARCSECVGRPRAHYEKNMRASFPGRRQPRRLQRLRWDHLHHQHHLQCYF